MVHVCSYPGCFNRNKPQRKGLPGTKIHSFHSFPLNHPEQLKLWLLTLRLDIDTPPHAVKFKKVCSDHFSDDDFKPFHPGKPHMLKASAVPNAYLQQPEVKKLNDDELEVQGAGVFLANVPQSTPVKQPDFGPVSTTRQFADGKSALRLLLTSPESVGKRIKPSTSGTYYARPAIHPHQSHPVSNQEVTEEQSVENLELDVSMLSIDPPSENKDLSFQPLSSTSTSDPSTEDEEFINEEYEEQQKASINDLKLQTELHSPVHMSGDGRSDSLGFSAKYNTYSLMDDMTDKIVHFELVQVTEASSSVAMEPVGFKRAVNTLQQHGITVDVLTTDRSPSIRKIMRVEYPQIHHEFDIWHVVKGLSKKLCSMSRYKGNKELQPWIRSICNHLWYCCATCGGDPDELIKTWKSIMFHITGVHSWTEEGTLRKCGHEELTAEQQHRKKWLGNDSHAFHTLQTLVLDKGLIKDLRQMALFKHTGQLEVFHSVLLKYCSKNLHFHYESMVARTQLAILDHNENVGRQQAKTSSGTLRYNVVFPKHTKEWVAKKIYEKTTQNFRQTLLGKVLKRRLDTTVAYKDHVSHLSHRPLPQNIATQPRPDKRDVIAKRLSRFGH
ncbi:hypothetical protein QQF64_035824 [Cirrhinus molitorella]|uniref:THAP-type domain-containing protein n=1 Tax=Cirrhinus molitorella TaxID=172907 RepID=A0ABR3NHK7_9TELE